MNDVRDFARFKISGDFGGGTVNLQAKSSDSSDSFSNTGDSYTEPVAFDVEEKTASKYSYRLQLTGSTSPNLTAFVDTGVIN